VKQILKQCLAYLPSRRPTFEEVLDLIKHRRPRGVPDPDFVGGVVTMPRWYTRQDIQDVRDDVRLEAEQRAALVARREAAEREDRVREVLEQAAAA
jgi:hypothetical protein